MGRQIRGYSAWLRSLAIVSGAATLILITGAPVSQAQSARLPAARPIPVATNSPSPSTNVQHPKVANPSPSPFGSPKPGQKPPSAGSRLKRALAASGLLAPSSVLPATTCSLAGTVRTCELWATTGTLNLAGAPGLPVWGFSTTPGPDTAEVPGPVLVANAGETVHILVHNQLPSQDAATPNLLSIEVPASGARPDIHTAIPGEPGVSFRFGSLSPGTYLYQAGATPFGARQVRMGLAGILVVRPSNFAACNCAYGNAAADGFVDETTLQLNEFDPAFNADPFGFDPIDFHPTEFTINGRAYDPANATAGKIDVASGDVLLLRYANLSDHERGVTIFNERQSILADDSYPLTNPGDVATKWLNPGQVSDSFVTIDPSFPPHTLVPVYEAGFHFNNGASTGLGGMFTYLDVVRSLAGSAAGPLTVATASPGTNTGTQDVVVTGTITASAGATLTDAEWFLDDPGKAGLAPPSQHFSVGGPSATYSFTITAATLSTLLLSSINRDGDHILWVHGKDSSGIGTWGVVSGDVFTYNATGPVIGGLSVHVSPTNGSRLTDIANGGGPLLNGIPQNAPNNDLVILGMAGASLSNFLVTGAEYCIDTTPCGTPVPLVLTPTGSNCTTATCSGTNQIDAYGRGLVTPAACVPVPSPPGVPSPSVPAAPGGGSVVSFCGAVPASVLLSTSLTEGVHTLFIHACEQIQTSTTACALQTPARWGAFTADAAINFMIDRTGPAPTAITLNPNPNNGHQSNSGNLNFLYSLQVASTVSDPIAAGVNSNVVYGEVFVTCSPVLQSSCQSVSGPIDPHTNAAPQNGSGAEMIPSGGVWNSPTILAYAYVPLAELTAYPEGRVRFWVHARDEAGNFGPWAFADLTYDLTSPVFDSPALPVPPAPPTSIDCSAGCTISFTAHDPLSGGVNSNIVQAEWFIDQGAHLICEANVPGCTPEVIALGDPGFGSGTQVPIAAPGTTLAAGFALGPQPAGTHIVFRVKDAAGNWSMENLVVTL